MHPKQSSQSHSTDDGIFVLYSSPGSKVTLGVATTHSHEEFPCGNFMLFSLEVWVGFHMSNSEQENKEESAGADWQFKSLRYIFYILSQGLKNDP